MTTPRRIVLDADGFRRLRESIAHWKRMATGELSDECEAPGALDCPLCNRWIEYDCVVDKNDRCPVYQATGRRLCARTPYFAAFHSAEDCGIRSAKFKRAAKAELAFLRGLLERAEEKP